MSDLPPHPESCCFPLPPPFSLLRSGSLQFLGPIDFVPPPIQNKTHPNYFVTAADSRSSREKYIGSAYHPTPNHEGRKGGGEDHRFLSCSLSESFSVFFSLDRELRNRSQGKKIIPNAFCVRVGADPALLPPSRLGLLVGHPLA